MAFLFSALAQQAYEELDVVQPGDAISSAMLTAAFLICNQMIDNWNAEDVMAPLWSQGSFVPTAGVQTYTFGVGGTLATAAAPIRIVSASSHTANKRVPCEVMSFEKFNTTVADPLASRSIFANIVARDQNFPLINVTIHPMPDVGPATLDIGAFFRLTAIAATSTDIANAYPGEWFAALRTGLAMALYPQYARNANPEVLASNFQNAKAAIAAKNARILGMQAQPAA